MAVLKRVVELSPEDGHEKYLYLGQLLGEADEAVAATRKGVELLQRKLDDAMEAEAREGGKGVGEKVSSAKEEELDEAMKDADEGEEEAEEGEDGELEGLREGLCSSLCSLAEMLMGRADDLAGPSGSGVCEEVEALLTRATAVCGSSPEPGQTLASLRYEQGRPEEALSLLQDSMKLWFRGAPDDDDNEGDLQEGRYVLDNTLCFLSSFAHSFCADDGRVEPSFEFRFECAKLLLELDNTTETAIQVSA